MFVKHRPAGWILHPLITFRQRFATGKAIHIDNLEDKNQAGNL
jgi:hypothetical protein